MALGNERTIDDRDYPCSGLLATQPPENSNSDGAVPVVPEEEEEEEADEFRPEPRLKRSRRPGCEVPLDQNYPVWRSNARELLRWC